MYGEGSAILKTISERPWRDSIISTPKGLTIKLAKHIPGTAEYSQEQQQYMRKMRDVTSQKV